MKDSTLSIEHLSLNSMFYKAGFVESWGKGTNNIVDDCIKMKLPEPEYRYSFGAVQVTLYKTTQEIKKLSTRARIINILKRDRQATRQDLASEVGVSETAIKQHLASLKKEGKLERIGSTKAGYWKVTDE